MPKRQPPPRVHIPTLLADSVKNKRAILFLGAGASKEAKNAANQTPPDADQLRDILATRFFAQPMKGRDVMAVALFLHGLAGPVDENRRAEIQDRFQDLKRRNHIFWNHCPRPARR